MAVLARCQRGVFLSSALSDSRLTRPRIQLGAYSLQTFDHQVKSLLVRVQNRLDGVVRVATQKPEFQASSSSASGSGLGRVPYRRLTSRRGRIRTRLTGPDAVPGFPAR